MNRIVIINKDFERRYEGGVMICERELEKVHKGSPDDFAVNEIWVDGMAQWTNRDGLKPADILEI